MYKYFSLLVLLFVQAKSFSQPGVVISNTSQLEYVEKNIYHLKDSTGNLSFNVVSQIPDSAFVFQPASTMSFGNSHVVWWFKFYILNSTKEDLYILFQNHELREAFCYWKDEDGSVDSIKTGLLLPHDPSQFAINVPVYKLGKMPTVVFLRIKSPNLYLPILAGTIRPVIKRAHLLDFSQAFVLGVLAILSIYNLIIFFFVKDRIYLYYFGYAASVFFQIFRTSGYLHEFLLTGYSPVNAERNLTSVITAVFYFLFASEYLNTKRNAPFLHKWLLLLLTISVILLPTDFIAYRSWHNDAYQLLFIIFITLLIITGIYIYKKGFKPALFFVLAFSVLAAGILLTLGGLLGFLSLNDFIVLNGFRFGTALEALILSFAVAYRFNLYKKEAHEKELQLVRERNRIMADLHDDIGASLSSMSIYSDLAGTVIENKPGESKALVNKISGTSKELMERMGDIIWSMKPADEEKYTVEARMKNYCNELLAPKNIVCEFDIDATLAASITNPEIRKNILLIAKEAINNIAKYSEATKAAITLRREKDIAVFSIQDNGKGFETLQIKQGNGLANMEQRCKVIGGKIQVNSKEGNGVHIICHLPIATISYTG